MSDFDPWPTPRGRGRPSTGVKIQVRIPADLLAKVDEKAELWDMTRAATVRDIIAVHVDDWYPD